MKRRRLTDLYARGKAVTVDDGHGPVSVWLAKLNPVENETVLRRANAARARYLLHGRDETSDVYNNAYDTVQSLFDSNPEEIVKYIISRELSEFRMSAEAELAAEEEWSKDDYLQGLFDAWPDLQEAWLADQEDPEPKRVFDELKRFNSKIDELVEGEATRLARDWDDRPIESIMEAAVAKFIDRGGDDAWVEEFHRASLWKAAREMTEQRKYYFVSRDEVDELDGTVYQQLITAYNEMVVDPIEGKDSVETPASSTSSEQQEEVATDQSSGPLVAAL